MEATSEVDDGSVVGMWRDGRLVATGKIMCSDENQIVHCRPLGSGNVQVRVEKVNFPDDEYADRELWGDMVGSLLVWRKSDLRNSEVVRDSDDLETSGDERRSPGGVIPKKDWKGITVKVVDDNKVIFATAEIVHVDIILEDVLLGDTHLGILFSDFVDGANQTHLKYRHAMKAWDMGKLIANDGKSMADHNAGQPPSDRDESSRKRSYVHKTRARKALSSSLTKKETCLTDEEIGLIAAKDCCSQGCCQHFPRKEATEARTKFWEKSFALRKEDEINAIVNALLLTSGEKVVVINGRAVCLEAWRIIHGRGRSQFYELKKAVLNGVRVSSHGNLGKRRMSERVCQAKATLTEIIDRAADHHPSKRRTMADNSRQILRELPKSLTWESIRNKVNSVNAECGLGPVSQANMSYLHRTYFRDVVIHKKGNNFSKCTTCSELLERKAHLTGLPEELEKFRADEKAHHDEHTEGRLLYHAWRSQSIQNPKAFLCIIHDKMDHGKTAIPSFPHCPKLLAGKMKFPITVTGILTHGHGPKAIAQYSAGVWPCGPNPTIGSLDSILRMLENPKPSISSLLEGHDATQVFQDLMFGRDKLAGRVQGAFAEDTTFISSLVDSGSSSETCLHRPLPRILKLQLDNCAGDNKNRYVFSYLSLLTARQVFEEIIVGFLIVGHTHEDVDAMFGHFSEALMHQQAYTLPELMDLLMRARKPSPVPHFIQEVPDFKSYVERFLLTGQETLVGHLKPRLFRFYVRHDSMPCMQYKMKTSDESWLPAEGIEMWSWGVDKRPHLPTGVPKRIPMEEIKMFDEVKHGLEKYVEFFEICAGKASNEAAKIHWHKLINYWETVLETLTTVPVQYRSGSGDELEHGFWPATKWRDNIPEGYRNVACELEPDMDYVGPQRAKPPQVFNPRTDVGPGDFVLVRPDTDDMVIYPVFLGKVVTEVTEGEVNAENLLEHECFVEWYRPFVSDKKRGESGVCSLKSRWENCWEKKWERDPGYPNSEKIIVNTILWSYKPRKQSPRSGLVKIPIDHARKAKDNLSRCLESELEKS